MVKNIDLEAPKSPHPKLYFLFLLLKFLSKRRFSSSKIAAKKIPRQVMPRYICNYLRCETSPPSVLAYASL